jgi:hypothetical protein
MEGRSLGGKKQPFQHHWQYYNSQKSYRPNMRFLILTAFLAVENNKCHVWHAVTKQDYFQAIFWKAECKVRAFVGE